jgi:hypothetical protein
MLENANLYIETSMPKFTNTVGLGFSAEAWSIFLRLIGVKSTLDANQFGAKR